MKAKILQATVVGLFMATAIVYRPQLAQALSLNVVGWGESNSVTEGMIVDGSITTAKIANLVSESSRLQEWVYATPSSIDTTTGLLTVDPSIAVTVPTGKAYYYLIKYEGSLVYLYSDRNGSQTSFYARDRITPLSGTTAIGQWFDAVRTGDRYSWSSLGNNSFWASPFHTTWLVRLTEGTHNIKFKHELEDSGTMNYGGLEDQRVQVMRVL